MTKYLLTGSLFLLSTLVALAQDVSIENSAVTEATEAEAVVEKVIEKPREMLYVTDQLRLSLYPNANDRSRALEFLSSGDKLGILEIEGQYALVISPSGRRGWVKRGFLLAQPTSKLLLEAEKKANEELLQEIEKLSNSKIVIDQYERDMDALTNNLERAKAAMEKAEQKVADMEQAALEKAELEAAIEAAKESNAMQPVRVLIDTAITYWQYLIPLFVLLLLFGALIAKLVIDARIRKRFHGLKLW